MDFKKIEKKWQAKWEKAKIFEANVNPKKKKFFTSNIIPYVNGNIHIGHSFTYTRVDAYARFKRMQGFNTCLAQGFHATGEPIIGTVKRLKKGDKDQIETFKIYGASDKDIQNFKKLGAEEVAKFWTKHITETMKLMGYSVDWRRKFILSITPEFSRFVEWQYNTLRKKGYVIQGTHPVIWCPQDQSPTGDHDRLKGEGESIKDFIWVKFRLRGSDLILMAGTTRPDALLGQVNLWVDPSATYMIVKVGDEKWVVGKESIIKIEDQYKKPEIIGTIKATELIGKWVKGPIVDYELYILPASFIDADVGSGIVYSALEDPVDLIELKKLQSSPAILKKYGLDSNVVSKLKPISIINIPGMGDDLGQDIIDEFGVKSENDKEKLEAAKGELNRRVFRKGIMKENCKKYAGMTVPEAQAVLKKDLINSKDSIMFYEMTGEVICRCTTKCHVKVLEKQWFLKFSDKEWKEKVKKCISQMVFYPEAARLQFLNTVDWLDDKACARKSGLGTKLPWDKEWTVETLSDSVIYMAYYTIARVINENKISADKLTDEVFDYIFVNKGDLKSVSRSSGLNEKLIKEMKDEFEYFYPLDLRSSGKDLLQNHLTYALFHHVAIWDDSKYWPRAYGVNGFVKVHGEKMAKSKGNIIPLKDLIEEYGTDLVRINITTANENMDDADWKEDSLKTFSSRLNSLANLVKNLKKAKRKSRNNLDAYLESIVQNCIKGTTENYEIMKFRSGVQYSAFQLLNEINYYIERCGGIQDCKKDILKESVSTAIKLLAPLASHVSEELWFALGNKTFISLEAWPEFDKSKVDEKLLELETIFKRTQEDLNSILKLAGNKKNAYLYFVTDKEINYFKESLDYLKNLFRFKKMEAYKVSDKKKYDPQQKAARAKYGKPAIFLE